MFKKKYRAGREVYFHNARIFFSPFFTLKVARNQLLYCRFRIAISKKTQKSAVKRNRLRRILSSCLEELQKGLVLGHDFLFIIKKEMLGKTRSQVFREVKEMLKRERFLL